MLAAQASGAQVEMFHLTFNNNGSRMNVGHPVALGVALGVADIITILRYFSAEIALQSQISLNCQ